MGNGVHVTGDLVDLSESGALVRCSENLPLETMGRFGIEIAPETFRTIALVKRHVPDVGIAFHFTQMTPHDRQLLHRLLLRVGKMVAS
jgi:hypothetical protein